MAIGFPDIYFFYLNSVPVISKNQVKVLVNIANTSDMFKIDRNNETRIH